MPGPRIDRLATLFFFNYVNKIRLRRKVSIPILMYHSVSNSKEKHKHPYYHTNTSPEVFAGHMKFLADNEYSVVGIGEALKILENPVVTSAQLAETPPNKRVVITFDDGFRDFYTNAFPVLQQHGFTATVFIPTGFIDNPRRLLDGKECMSWNEILELQKKGVSIGTHSVNHSKFESLTRKEIDYEIRHSKYVAESKTGCCMESFSYPYAYPETDHDLLKLMKKILLESGYENAVTTRIGRASFKPDRYALKRLPVNTRDDICFLKAKIEGGYDWIYSLQYVYKSLKAMPGARPFARILKNSSLKNSRKIDE
jgi:peptidoglycan/xylan/chitin deacetylase (PgdA/CDA1 family)